MTTYWFFEVWGGVDPNVMHGPFAKFEERDAKAREVQQAADDEVICFWLDVVDGVPEVGSFTNYFMEENSEDEEEST